MIPYIETNDGITFIIFGASKTLAHDDNRYDTIRDMILNGAQESDVDDELRAREREVARVVQLTPRLSYNAGAILCDGVALHNYAVDKLIELIDAELPCKPLINFLDKLIKNPSYRVVEHLYEFLEFGHVPLTQDGNFVAYKAISADWTDIHSGRFDNSIGATPRVARNQVDEDPDRTCSNGLHVCSFSYLPHFSHSNGHVIAVEVSPEDVVAIPRDYNNTKMRCAGYKVIAEVTDYYKDNRDILSESPFYGDIEADLSSDSPKYRVEILGFDTTNWELDFYPEDEDEAIDAVNLNIDEQGWRGSRAFRPNEQEPFMVRIRKA